MNARHEPDAISLPTLGTTRRRVLQAGGAALAGGALAPFAAGLGFHAAGRDTLRVGLIGCGGRGRGAAENALRADPGVEIVALGDTFADMAKQALVELQKLPEVGARVRVDDAHMFVGFDAYRGVIESSDVVLLATTPHFRPLHLRAAVEAGKHLFVEKPVAVDAPGLRSVMESCKLAAEKKLSLVSGLCYRYENKKRETIERIHGGAIGEIRAMQTSYNTGGLWHRGTREQHPEWSEMEYQVRNWLYFTWLSGDHIAEQHIHSLDKLLWAMKDEPPVRCTSSGGRTVRTEPIYGNVYDHFQTAFEWASGVKGFSSCRQWVNCAPDVSDHCFGTKGTAHIQTHQIEGENPWRHRGEDPDDMYQNEHDALFASIRKNAPLANGDYMCKATLMAIMARMSAYTGQTITWEQALASQEDLSPRAYEWGDLETAPIARPGVNKFV
jgi:predicted dehydrogenase